MRELDKGLTSAESEEWNNIYDSYRSGSLISGKVIGVDFHSFDVKAKKKDAPKKELACLIAINYMVKIIIPEPKIWIEPMGATHVLRSMCGATIKYVITYIDRENGFAIASRKAALEKLRFATRNKDMLGKTVKVEIISVGRNVCTAHFNGYDVLLSQKDISYNIVKDLRTDLHPGQLKYAVIKEWNPKDSNVKFSIKETTKHPFDGVDIRHPVSSTRMATIISKYNGGVFCRLADGITDILCTYDAVTQDGGFHYDGDFHIDDTVELIVKKINYDRKLVYGKILRKLY